jgi:hypothetical protein
LGTEDHCKEMMMFKERLRKAETFVGAQKI